MQDCKNGPGKRLWIKVDAQTEHEAAEKISQDIAELIRGSEGNARLSELQLDPVGSTPAEAVKFFAKETALWSKVIRDANLTPQ